MPPAARLLALFMLFSVCAWSVVAWVHVVPAIDRRSKREALLIVVMPHMFRTIGAMAMFPGLSSVPEEWALPLAWGDGTTAMLAMLSMVALKRSWAHATKLVWVFNLFGLLDMLHNGYGAAHLEVAPQMGPIAYVVGFGVPGMLVLHILVFRTLLRREVPTAAT
jgi:hypothetical protein